MGAMTSATTLTVSTANVNGLRAATGKGYVEWLAATEADVVCLQEVRAEPPQLAAHVREPEGWHTLWAPSVAKGRAGVALLSRTEPQAQRIGFGSAEFDTTGRYVEFDLPGLTVASLYLPSGEVGTPRQDEKERFLEEFLEYLKTPARPRRRRGTRGAGLRRLEHRPPRGRPQELEDQPEERRLPPRGARLVHPHPGRGRLRRRRPLAAPGRHRPVLLVDLPRPAFDNDAGWRIDYHMATPGLAQRATRAVVEKAATHVERWSDHAPVTVTFEWP